LLQVVTLKVTDDVAELLNGKLDVLPRTSGGSYPGLRIDRFVQAVPMGRKHQSCC